MYSETIYITISAMKSKIFFPMLLTGLAPAIGMAQDDDLYFSPKDEVVEKPAVVPKRQVEAATYYMGSNRDVDEYNRQGKYWRHYQKVGTDSVGNDIIEFSEGKGVYPDSVELVDTYAEDYTADDDFRYTRGFCRWDGFYDPWFYRYYGYGPYYWSSAYWTWYDPWYYGYWGWYDPWYYGYWGGWYRPWYYAWGYYRPWYGGWHRPSGGHVRGDLAGYTGRRSFGFPNRNSSASSARYNGNNSSRNTRNRSFGNRTNRTYNNSNNFNSNTTRGYSSPGSSFGSGSFGGGRSGGGGFGGGRSGGGGGFGGGRR